MAITISNRTARNYNAPDPVTGLPRNDQYLDFIDEHGVVVATLNVPASSDPTFAVYGTDLGTGIQTVYSATVTLTDAQIKALPTTPVEIVAAPGAGKILAFISGFLVCDNTAGAYSNVSSFDETNAQGSISFTIALTDNLIVGAVVPSLNLLSGLATLACLVPPILAPGQMTSTTAWIPTANAQPVTSYADEPIAIQSYNSGNFTGGNAANTLKVTVLYTIIDV